MAQTQTPVLITQSDVETVVRATQTEGTGQRARVGLEYLLKAQSEGLSDAGRRSALEFAFNNLDLLARLDNNFAVNQQGDLVYASADPEANAVMNRVLADETLQAQLQETVRTELRITGVELPATDGGAFDALNVGTGQMYVGSHAL